MKRRSPPRRNIFCVGKNYHEHAHEFSKSGFDSSAGAGAVPKNPIIFSKVPEKRHRQPRRGGDRSKGVGGDRLRGRACGDHRQDGPRHFAREDAFDHVWGYTIVNDVTARDLQGRYSQWLIGKSQDTFCPMGPWAVTKDEIDLDECGDPLFRQRRTAAEFQYALLIFDIPTIIATLSEGLTLYPGDIIATGTPAGVGIGFDPPKYLKGGDVVRVEIDGIGALENPSRSARHDHGRGRNAGCGGPSGDGFPVVMIHGLGGTTNMFQPQLAVLGSYRVIRLDLPGSGRSPRPMEPLSMEAMTEAVITAVAQSRRHTGAFRRPFDGDHRLPADRRDSRRWSPR